MTNYVDEINKNLTFEALKIDFEEKERREISKKIKKIAGDIVVQLRFAKLSPELLQRMCAPNNAKLFDSAIMHIEKHTRYQVMLNDRGLLVLRTKTRKKPGATGIKEDIKKAKIAGSGISGVEYPERWMNNPNISRTFLQKLTKGKLPSIKKVDPEGRTIEYR